jgi:transcriptional regulator with XRE-family HTH domain
MNDSKDYLDEMIEESCKDPIFDRIWASSEAVHQLVELRVKLGLTQEDVAKTMKVKRPRVSEIEAHPENVSFSRLSLYASALGATFSIQEPQISSVPMVAEKRAGRPVGTTRRRHTEPAGALIAKGGPA